MAIEILQQLVGELGQLIGIADVVLDDDGLCLFQVDEKILLNIQYDEEIDAVVLFTTLGNYDDQNKSALFHAILEANFFWLGTGGATFSINSMDNSIMLTYREVLSGMTFSRFQQVVEGFIDTADEWGGRIRDMIMNSVTEEQEKTEETILPGMRV